MWKSIFVYSALLAVLLLAVQSVEYFFLIRVHIFEIYGGFIACLFLGLGLWLGKKKPMNKDIPLQPIAQEEQLTHWGISKREYEVLLLLGQGLSNQQIADKLFVSTNTIKTHTSRLFEKLAVKNRTQALLKAKEQGLIV